MSWKRKKRMTWTNVLVVIGVFVVGIGIMAMVCLAPYLNSARELGRRTACAMNLGSLGQGISMYQAAYKDQYPALANPATLAQGAIDERPEMVAVADTSEDSAFLNGNVKGNGSVNAYYLLVHQGYLEEEGFRCPDDASFESPDERVYDLGFDGWRNLSYAFQPTSIDPAAFSVRPSYKSKGDLVIASDQVVDRNTPLTTTDNRPKENNAVNHGYEYVNALLVSNSVRKKSRTKGADSTVSKWGYAGDEIFTKTQSTDPIKQANDSRLMGKEGAE